MNPISHAHHESFQGVPRENAERLHLVERPVHLYDVLSSTFHFQLDASSERKSKR